MNVIDAYEYCVVENKYCINCVHKDICELTLPVNILRFMKEQQATITEQHKYIEYLQRKLAKTGTTYKRKDI